MNIDSLTLTYILGGVTALLLLWVIVLEWRISKFLKGSSGKTLEGSITTLISENKDHKATSKKTDERLSRLEKDITEDLAKIGLMKFNAFSEQGGNQSFALALLDRNGNGILFSSMYTRERVSTYMKNIENFTCSSDLLPEEKKALEKAKQS